MDIKILYSNPYIQLVEKPDGFYIESFKKGYTMEQFNELLNQFPQIKITHFLALRSAILSAPRSLSKFADKRSPIEIEISPDGLKAFMTLYFSEEEWAKIPPEKKKEKLLHALYEQDVCFGILEDTLVAIQPRIRTVVAQGIPSIEGETAQITMYKIEEPKPTLTEDGGVNHYELNLINKVQKGDWLGEKVHPTLGTPGKNVFGQTLPAKPGKNLPFLYDKKSIDEVHDPTTGISTLYAKKAGAAVYKNNILHVEDVLEIQGDVSYETGNIDFDGFVNITGSIEENFMVEALQDIEVMGEMGVGGVQKIESTQGRIYIRGGIAGKNKTIIRCKKDLYTKFASDCTIECEGSVYIGFYCINCNITAKEVILESLNSRIIGGTINAQVKVVAGELGNRSEIPTTIQVSGFDRKAYEEEFEHLKEDIEKLNQRLLVIRDKVGYYAKTSPLEPSQMEEYRKLTDEFQQIKDQLTALHEKRKQYGSYLRTRGEGEIVVHRKIHRNTVIQLKHIMKRIPHEVNAPTTYYIIGREFRTL